VAVACARLVELPRARRHTLRRGRGWWHWWRHLRRLLQRHHRRCNRVLEARQKAPTFPVVFAGKAAPTSPRRVGTCVAAFLPVCLLAAAATTSSITATPNFASSGERLLSRRRNRGLERGLIGWWWWCGENGWVLVYVMFLFCFGWIFGWQSIICEAECVLHSFQVSVYTMFYYVSCERLAKKY